MNRYGRLLRFDKPAGIVLLWAPTAWALWLADQGQPAWRLVVFFLCGTICMHAAGCVINDLADRNIDKHVKRTRLRPITNGEVSIQQALGILSLLLLAAGWIALQLPVVCWYEAIAALVVTLIYPFGKRFVQAPQLILGLAFSMGIPMAFAASQRAPDWVMGVLMGLNFLWIVAYDTIYALIDREDDLRIGVRSTAILFGPRVIEIVFALLLLCHTLWLVLFALMPLSAWFGVFWLLGLCVLIYQYRLLRSHPVEHAMRAFLWNAGYGMLMWCGLFIYKN